MLDSVAGIKVGGGSDGSTVPVHDRVSDSGGDGTAVCVVDAKLVSDGTNVPVGDGTTIPVGEGDEDVDATVVAERGTMPLALPDVVQVGATLSDEEAVPVPDCEPVRETDVTLMLLLLVAVRDLDCV